MTPAFFLNALDGLLGAGHPVLWIATFKDASLEDLRASLLDRPGRFDRIWVIEPPEAGLIPELVLRYTPAQACPPDRARAAGAAVAAAAAGLSCVHIREACWLAALEAIEHGGDYAEALARAVARVRDQSELTRRGRVGGPARKIGIRA